MTFRHLRNVRGFLSDYYLGSVFGRQSGRGRRRKLSDRETDLAYRRFRRIREAAEGKADEPGACRERFLRPFLRDVLGYHLGAGGDGIHPLFPSAEAEAAGLAPLLSVLCAGWSEDFDGGRGGSQPRRRLETALGPSALRYGLLASGERLRLLRAAGDGPRGAYLEIDLTGLVDDDAPESFAAFYRLFSATNFSAGADGRIPMEEIERESRQHAEKVSEDLKRAVFSAAETLADGLVQDAVVAGRIRDARTLTELDLRLYRDAALTALYRVLFILYAEARDPRLLEGHQLYRESYSAQGLVEEVLLRGVGAFAESSSALWGRLRALFRIYDEGLPAITPWDHIPPRGSEFFGRETAEGRLLETARLPDRTVARVVLDVATTAPRRGVGRERVSFRELDIESLGSVYEGLLEFEPRVAEEPRFELRVQARPFVLSGSEARRLVREKGLKLQGDLGSAQDLVAAEAQAQRGNGRDGACDEAEDEETAERDDAESADDEEGVKKGGTARVLRQVPPGTFHFVPGAGRKGSGSFYTPRELVQDVVRHALGPLVGGRSAAEIERLRVLDPACGSAHFLVEAMRFLGQALHKTYVDEHAGKAPPEFRSTAGGWDTDWQARDEDARAGNSEARAWCKRRIAERCLFGVDLNPMAVNLARVSLWIESMAADRPLSYFDHHVRCGNSLLGTWSDRLHLPPIPTGRERPGEVGIFDSMVGEALRAAAQQRRLIDTVDPAALLREGIEPESKIEQEYKERLRREAEGTLRSVKLLFDLRSAVLFVPEIWRDRERLWSLVGSYAKLDKEARSKRWWPDFGRVRDRERFFHWELEFPEVFLDPERPGFDAVLGNPPWDKVLPSKHEFYARHDVLIRAYKGNELERRIRELHEAHPGLVQDFKDYRERTRGVAQCLRKGGDFPLSRARSQAAHEDVSKYFLDRAARTVRTGGRVGFIVPSVVYNGDGCVGLRNFLLTEAAIERFYGFENRGESHRAKIFPIHPPYKFVSLVFRKGTPAESFAAAFMRHDLAELESSENKPWIVRSTRNEVERLSPETYAFLEYRSPRDQEIVQRMYEGRPTLGGGGPGSWGAQLVSWRAHEIAFNASEDKDLWTDPGTGKVYSPVSVLDEAPSSVTRTIDAMRQRGFWPVYEGKHIDQFLTGIKPFRWWLSLEQAKAKYDKLPRSEATLVFRETASNTNERTCIAAVLPEWSAAAHKLTDVKLKNVTADQAATVLNSLCFDYALRLRTAGTNVSFTYIRPMPIPPASIVRTLPIIPTQLAWERGLEHISDDRELWPQLWAANRAVAEAYDLGPEDFEHILASFPVFARKRREFYAYLTARLREWKDEIGERTAGVRYRDARASRELRASEQPEREGIP